MNWGLRVNPHNLSALDHHPFSCCCLLPLSKICRDASALCDNTRLKIFVFFWDIWRNGHLSWLVELVRWVWICLFSESETEAFAAGSMLSKFHFGRKPLLSRSHLSGFLQTTNDTKKDSNWSNGFECVPRRFNKAAGYRPGITRKSLVLRFVISIWMLAELLLPSYWIFWQIFASKVQQRNIFPIENKITALREKTSNNFV